MPRKKRKNTAPPKAAPQKSAPPDETRPYVSVDVGPHEAKDTDKQDKHGQARTRPSRSSYWLSFFSDFACSRCALCCSRGWNIAIKSKRHEALSDLIKNGRLAPVRGPAGDPKRLLIPAENIAKGFVARLYHDKAGLCAFLDTERGNGCVIQQRFGHNALPLVCQVFPRIAYIRAARVTVTLSAACPTAAETFFREDTVSFEIVADPPGLNADHIVGLNMSDEPAPRLRPGARMTWEAYEAWERGGARLLGRGDYTAEEALILLTTSADKARAREGEGPATAEFLDGILERDRAQDSATIKRQIAALPSGLDISRVFYARVLRAIPGDGDTMADLRDRFLTRYGEDAPDGASRFAADHDRFVRAAWRDFDLPLRRFCAARLFANDLGFLARGLKSALYSVIMSLLAVRGNATLLCAERETPLDRETLREAFGLTDYLLRHGISSDWLVKHFGAVEDQSLAHLVRPLIV